MYVKLMRNRDNYGVYAWTEQQLNTVRRTRLAGLPCIVRAPAKAV